MTLIRVSMDNEAEVKRALRSVPGKARAAFANAMNRSGRYARTEAIRMISDRVNFPRRYLQQRMELLRARSSDLTILIRARKRETLLSRFPYKQRVATSVAASGRKSTRKAGIQVTVKRFGTTVLRGGFLVPLKRGRELGAGAVGIAIRQPGARRAYEVLHSTSVHHAFSDVLDETSVLATRRFNDEIRTALDTELRSL